MHAQQGLSRSIDHTAVKREVDTAKGQTKKHIVTKASQEIPHPTTGLAQPDLTDEIERDRV